MAGALPFPGLARAALPPAPGVPGRLTRQWLNQDIVAPFEAVLHELVETGLIRELKTYDGGWVVRNMRGTQVPSWNSWGLAVDFNAQLNPLGVAWGSRPGMFSAAFLAVWRKLWRRLAGSPQRRHALRVHPAPALICSPTALFPGQKHARPGCLVRLNVDRHKARAPVGFSGGAFSLPMDLIGG